MNWGHYYNTLNVHNRHYYADRCTVQYVVKVKTAYVKGPGEICMTLDRQMCIVAAAVSAAVADVDIKRAISKISQRKLSCSCWIDYCWLLATTGELTSRFPTLLHRNITTQDHDHSITRHREHCAHTLYERCCCTAAAAVVLRTVAARCFWNTEEVWVRTNRRPAPAQHPNDCTFKIIYVCMCSVPTSY